MSKYLKLEIHNACHENWHSMLPEEQGRFCQSCNKKVIDFTSMNDWELTQYFQQTVGTLCGRFMSNQLNRDLIIPRKPQPWIKYFFQATLPAFLLSLKSASQTTKVEYPIHVSPQQKTLENTNTKTATITVEGHLRDEENKNIPYASIMLKGTKRGVQADSTGKFIFKDLSAPATLIISCIGYMTQEIQVQPEQKNLVFTMQTSTVLMGEVITVGYVVTNRIKKQDRVSKPLIKDERQIKVYPNPLRAGNSFSIQCNKIEYGNYSLQLFNISGVQVHVEKVDILKGMKRIELFAPHLAAGNYFLKLTHNKKGTIYTEQLLIVI